MRPPADFVAYFWSRVSVGSPTNCWEWKASRHRAGYGAITRSGKQMTASRMAWILSHGPISDGLSVLHRCDNPPCCNPDHLWLGTDKDNSDDKISKGRYRRGPAPRGEAHARHILTEAQVREIRLSALPRKELARIHGVSKSTIDFVINRRLWKHVA